MNQPQPKGRRKPPLAGLSSSTTFPIPLPQFLKPFLMFLARHLPVLGCGVETSMPQVLLEHPEPVPRIIVFYRHDGECVP